MTTSGIGGTLKKQIAGLAVRSKGASPVSFDDLLASTLVGGRLVRLRRPSRSEFEALGLANDLRRTVEDRERAGAALAALTGLSPEDVAALPRDVGLTLLSALEIHVKNSGGLNA